MQENELTENELNDLSEIASNTLKRLIKCADKHNIDRDSLVKHFVEVFGMITQISTFKNYTIKGGTNDE